MRLVRLLWNRRQWRWHHMSARILSNNRTSFRQTLSGGILRMEDRMNVSKLDLVAILKYYMLDFGTVNTHPVSRIIVGKDEVRLMFTNGGMLSRY